MCQNFLKHENFLSEFFILNNCYVYILFYIISKILLYTHLLYETLLFPPYIYNKYAHKKNISMLI